MKGLISISNVLVATMTATYVVLTYSLLKASTKSIREQARPYVIAVLPVEEYAVVLSIKNIGNRPARDVRISFEPNIDGILDHSQFKDELKQIMYQPFMPPNFEVKIFLVSSIKVLNEKELPSSFKVNIEYADSEGRPFDRHSYPINIRNYLIGRSAVEHGANHFLEKISNSLTDMASDSKQRGSSKRRQH